MGTPTQPLLSREYDDTILDELVEVVLFFTPDSKKLYRVYVSWNRNPAAKQIPERKIESLYSELEKVLSGKYAKGASIISSSYEKRFNCGDVTNGLAKQVKIRRSAYTIELLQSVPCNWLSITYNDTELSKLNLLEIERRQQFSKADYKRF